MTTRKALFFAPLRHTLDELCESISRRPDMRTTRSGDQCTWNAGDLTLQFDVAETAQQACELVLGHYYHFVVIDCRHLPHHLADAEAQEQAVFDLLHALSSERDRERRYPFQRLILLAGDEDEERVDRLIFDLGKRHVGACLRDLSLSPRIVGDHEREARERMIDQFWGLCNELLLHRKRGKKAIAVAGGGITGMYYELGVLKCLHDSIDVDLREFDMFLGISAGAVISACLANHIHVDELVAHIGEIEGDWGSKFRVQWGKLNLGQVPRRLLDAQRDVLEHVISVARGETRPSLAALVGAYGTLFGPLFDHGELERFLRKLFSKPGRTNDFRELPSELYIGATDQDSREHVIFGQEPQRHVPISEAVQASTAVHPFFTSVEIEGRYYTDGAITRTSNLRAAIDHGSDLVFLIDPFVPLISDQPGYNARQGNLWIIQQDIKTVAFTRFEQVSEEILRQNPHVNAYTFVPGNRMRRLMSQNPFATANFHEIVCEAYLSTFRRLQLLEYKIHGELASHGIALELAPVAETAQRLETATRPDVRIILEYSRV